MPVGVYVKLDAPHDKYGLVISTQENKISDCKKYYVPLVRGMNTLPMGQSCYDTATWRT